jgi:hypothetical protein
LQSASHRDHDPATAEPIRAIKKAENLVFISVSGLGCHASQRKHSPNHTDKTVAKIKFLNRLYVAGRETL